MARLNRLLFLLPAGFAMVFLNCYNGFAVNGNRGRVHVNDMTQDSLSKGDKSGLSPLMTLDTGLRPVSLKITNRRGELSRKSVFFYYLSSNRQPVQVRGGAVVIPGVAPADTLFFISDKYMGILPLDGFDSLRMVVSGEEMFSVRTPGKMVHTGYGKVPQALVSIPVSRIPVEDDVRMMPYKDLASYMTGRIAGVQIVTNPAGLYEVQIRGGSSLMASNAALIILDGVIVSDFDTANQMVNILDLKSIEILKDGSSYGAQGVNGVVIITTKSGGDR